MNTGEEKLDAAKIVASAVLGYDFERIIVAGRDYVIYPPTIKRLAGAVYWLSDLGEGETLRDLLAEMKDYGNLPKALSWFIQGDEGLAEELSEGSVPELIDGVESAFKLIETANFIRLSVLVRSAKNLIAKQK